MRSSSLTGAACALAAALLLAGTQAWGVQLDMTPGVTDISQNVFGLHRIILGICVVIGIGVYGAMAWSILHHRKSRGAQPAHFHESLLVEIAWTIIPLVILIVMAIPATKTLVAMHDSRASELTIRVTGSQWKWHYEYLSYKDKNDIGLSYYSLLSTPREQFERQGKGLLSTPDFNKSPNYLSEVDKPLVIPTGTKVRFLITSDDVIHAWWMPDFAIKQDAMPGFVSEAWTVVPADKEGVYRGRCAELCGKDHAFMPVVVEAVSPDAFNTWLGQAKVQAKADAKAAAASADYKFASLDEAMKVGEEVYNGRCLACHQAGGVGLPPMFPALKGSKLATDKALKADHITIVLNGKNAMPGWKAQLTPKELAAVITFERNAWGNDTGDLVQPSDVAGK